MPTTPRRRWFQFRLRTLLIVLAVLAIPFAWIAKERRQSAQEREVARRLEFQDISFVEFGGPYERNYEPQNWWRQLAEQVLGQRILEVWISPSDFNDLACLSRLTNLQTLSIGEIPVDDLAPLAGLDTLREMVLATHVRDLTPLASLKNLECLHVREAKFTKEEVEALQKALPNCKIVRDRFF